MKRNSNIEVAEEPTMFDTVNDLPKAVDKLSWMVEAHLQASK